ncbi:M48 family metallopeptidase [Moraxellaceae bacterium AER2_44_116]|nr:M48 family metallopeptidase [Moraxellaceae bacterium]TQC95501.1 M48 family metallopeptidase [Moraxellaceae bacterium AER2_44_116]
MNYSNPELPTSEPESVARGELGELIRLLCIVIVIIVVIVGFIDRLVYFLAPRTPFIWETYLAQTVNVATFIAKENTAPTHHAIERELQQRANGIARLMLIPTDMPITVHYVDTGVVNAFATIGGHLFIYQGLLDKIQFEEELDAVLIHEITHVYKQHIAQQMSRSLLLIGTLSAMHMNNSGLGRWILGDSSQLGLMAYSRSAEKEADLMAMQISQKRYGHTQGMVSLMKTLDKETKNQPQLAWTQSHPDTISRILAAQQYMPTGNTTLPIGMHDLPAYFKHH